MKKISTILAMTAFFVGASFGISMFVQAQAVATMPYLYDQNGTVVNSGVTALPAGSYYLGAGPAQGGHIVNYYGNGVFYDPTTLQYGGSVGDPNGTAGAALNYVAPTVTPGVPNTGAGGLAVYAWFVLALSGAALASSVLYIKRHAAAA